MPTRCLWVAAVLTCLVAPVGATEPGFGGKWSLDTERSDSLQPNRPAGAATMTLRLIGDDLVVSLSSPQFPGRDLRYTYVTDGKPHDVPGLGGGSRSVRAKWNKKGVLQAAYTISRPSPAGTLDLDTIERWQLSKDRSSLVVTYQTRIPDRRPRIVEQHWNRIEDGSD